MTIEEFLIDYLAGELSVPVSGSVPHPMPDEFVTVELTGGYEVNRIPAAQIHVKSWSTSRAAAADLNEAVKAAMFGSISLPEISRCGLNASYNNPDLSTNKPRYSASFEVVYLF